MVTSAAVLRPRSYGSAEHRFFAGMAWLLLAVVIAGFSRSTFLRPWFPEFPAGTEAILYVHGAVFLCWYLLLVLQPALIASGRVQTHMAVGRLGAGLAAVMVLFGWYVTLLVAARPGGFMGVPVPPLAFVAIPAFEVGIFGLLVTAAVAKRRDAQSHKRLMLIASISMMGAAVSRLPFAYIETGSPIAFFATQDLLLLPLIAWDLRSRGRLHPATLWAGLLFVASQPFRLWLMGTEGWIAFAGALVSLVR